MRLSVMITFIISLMMSVSVFAASQRTISLPALGENATMQSSTATKNKAAGDAFLTKNKVKPGVITLPSGLQYKVITQGTGQVPKKNDTVTVHYAGTLIDGTEFDSSVKRGQPATFPVTAVIPGWVQALQIMPVGSTWELYIPASLAYGERGAPPLIGPNQTLIFKVSLIGVDQQ